MKEHDIRARLAGLFDEAVRAAAPGPAVARAVPGLNLRGPVTVIALGKAARAMAMAALESAGEVQGALVVTNAENAGAIPGARLFIAGHPVPDAGGLAAGAAVIEALDAAQGDILVLVSGGGSALLPAPVEGVTLDEKAAVSRLLLASGWDITRMNMVRQHLSRLKGGGMLRLAGGRRVVALVLSDVIGDDLRVIASGPTVAPIAPRSEVVATLRAEGLWSQLPRAAQTALLRPEPAQPPQGETHLIGSNALSLAAMARAEPEAVIWDDALTGDVARAAHRIVDMMRAATSGTIGLCGGETTVVLRGTGAGGRNQELALRVAVGMAGFSRPWAFLSGGTDGRDGPTDAAGGLVDEGTLSRISARGGDIAALLANNDSYHGLALAGDLLITGGTGTNVADVQIAWIG